MTVTVAEEDLRHRALIGDTVCCEAGHPDAIEAAQHAWRLTGAMARKAPLWISCRAAILMDEGRRCTAKSKRSGERCKRPASPGFDKCYIHVGVARGDRKATGAEAAALELARQAVVTYGLPLDVSPGDALLDEVRYTAGHVAWLREKVRELEDRDLVWGMTEQAEKTATEFKGVDTTYGATPNVWVDLYMRERKHLVDVAKAAIAAGIEERKVRLAEQQGALVAMVIRGILADLKLTPDQRELVAEVVPRRLRALAG